MAVHVSWNQVQEDAYSFVVADLTADGWEFWERDSWEIRWYRMKTTDELIARARSFLCSQELAKTVPTMPGELGRSRYVREGIRPALLSTTP